MASTTDSWITSDETVLYDSAMATHDCWGTMAHVLMMRKQGILVDADAKAALTALVEIEASIVENGFPYDRSLGAQLTLEKLIVEKTGEEVGYQVHTGRSRNDQVLVTQKLFVRDRILSVFDQTARLVCLLVDRAEREANVIMPGYTHMQPARPTTVGQWMAMHADTIARDLDRLRDTYKRHNTSPLGAADSYGTSWPLDRAYTAELLAFDGVDEISIEAVSSRGESDTDFLAALSFLATHISRAAQDLLLFTTFEYGYAELTEKVAERMGKLTGSSIMPQKKNPDVLELLRGQASEIHAYLVWCLELSKALPMGYNRDTRDTKAPIIRGTSAIENTVQQMCNAIEGVQFDKDRMLQAVKDNYSMATDLAEYFAQRCKIPFRIVHGIVGRVVKEAVASNTKLYDVPLSTFKVEAESVGYAFDLTSEELASALDPIEAVQRRQCLGGPAAAPMAAWVSARRERVGELRGWVTQEVARIADCREAVRSQTIG